MVIIRTQEDKDEVALKIQSINLGKQAWRVDAEPYKPSRSLAQNKLAFRYYRLLGKATGNGEQYERLYCKYEFGCPILLADDKDGAFTTFYETLINTLEYEQLVDSMEFVDITKLFKVGQFQDYLVAIEQYAAKNQYALMTDNDLRSEAFGIKG